MNVIERTVRGAGYQSWHVKDAAGAGVILVGDVGTAIDDETMTERLTRVGALSWLSRWFARALQPVNTIMPLIDAMVTPNYIGGYDSDGNEANDRVLGAPGKNMVRDVAPQSVEWSELEIVVERMKSLEKLLIAVEAGLPVPAWILKNRWGDFEAGWFVFRPNSLVTIFDPKPKAEGGSVQSKTKRPLIHADERERLLQAREWKASLREVIGSESMGSSGRRAGLDETFTNPLSATAKLLLLHVGHPARSRGLFTRKVELAAQHTDSRVRAWYAAQRQSGKRPKGDSSRMNLKAANTVRTQRKEERIKQLREILKKKVNKQGNLEFTTGELARALGCDARTVRNYLKIIQDRGVHTVTSDNS